MTQSVELMLDTAAEEAVLAQWRLLADAGLPSQAHHTGASNRPHVTLTASPLLAEAAEGPVARVCAERLPRRARWGSLAVFGADPVVLVRLLVVTPPLLELHAAVARLVEVPEESLVAPGRWTPHVTLARRMPLDRLADALRVLGPGRGDPVRLTGARRWDSERRRDWTVV